MTGDGTTDAPPQHVSDGCHAGTGAPDVVPGSLLDRYHRAPALTAALVGALGELGEIPTSHQVNAGPMRYSYADLGDVLRACRPVLKRHGLAIHQHLGVDDTTVTVTTVLLHDSGQVLVCDPLSLQAGGRGPQQTGSAATYGRRYSALALLGIATDDDDDGAAAQAAASVQTQPRRQARGGGASTEQVQAVRDGFAAAGITGRADQLAMVAAVTGVDYRAAGALTPAHADQVTGALTQMAAGNVAVTVGDDGRWTLTPAEAAAVTDDSPPALTTDAVAPSLAERAQKRAVAGSRARTAATGAAQPLPELSDDELARFDSQDGEP